MEIAEKMKIFLCLFNMLFFFCCSCTEPSRLESVLLQSGTNRPELEKVLSHYKDDLMKYRASCFLIEHMPGKYSLEAESEDDPYRNFLRYIPAKDSINWKLDSCHVGHLLDSVSRIATPRIRKVEDLKVVTADFFDRQYRLGFPCLGGIEIHPSLHLR